MIDYQSCFCRLAAVACTPVAIVTFKQAFFDGSNTCLHSLELADVHECAVPAIAVGQFHQLLLEFKKFITIIWVFHGLAKIVSVHDHHFIVVGQHNNHGTIILARPTDIVKCKCFSFCGISRAAIFAQCFRIEITGVQQIR